jgi:hypothetical protein
MAENAVRIDSIAGSFQTSVGTAVPGPNLGVGLQVATGTLVSGTTLTAQATTGAGTTADFGSARANVTLVITTSAGVSAGAVALELSQDNTNWFRRTAVTTNTASTVFSDSAAGAWRYARANVTTGITGGTVSATLMAA